MPLRFKNLHAITRSKEAPEFNNPKVTKAVQILEGLVQDAIEMTSHNKIIHYGQDYVMDRDPVRPRIVEQITAFHECEKTILQEICTHEADFICLRIHYLLAKLKTYVGLARISEHPISEAQWIDWFRQEVLVLLEKLKGLIQASLP